MRKITFRADRSEYVGETVFDIVEQLRGESHDRADNHQDFMRAVAGRAKIRYDRAVRTDSAIHFLRDLEKLGEGRLVKEIL